MEQTFSMSELVRLTGIDARTIRYYISQGLLPKPLKRGRGADYSGIHLDRLKLIAILKNNLKLEEIQARLNSASPDEIRQLLDKWVEPKAKSSARNYLKSIEDEFQQKSIQSEDLHVPAFMRQRDKKKSSLGHRTKLSISGKDELKKFDEPLFDSVNRTAETVESFGENNAANPINKLIAKLDNSDPPNFESSYRRARIWKVIPITPGIELHLKDPDELTLARMERASELIRNTLTGVDDD